MKFEAMKHKLIILSFIICFLSFSPFGALAQSWTKKAAKAVFTLKTFNDEGTLVGSATGVFIDEQGTALSCFEPFVGASRAVIIDAADKEYPVMELLGANDIYDVVKFRVAAKKTQPIALAGQPAAEGASAWLLPYRESKQAKEAVVSKVQNFNGDYAYYTMKVNANDNADSYGQPLIDSDGLLLALIQKPISATDTMSYAVSARFADSLSISGLSINDKALRSTQVKKALPDDVNQAILTLFVAATSLDSLHYAQLLDDFVGKFPDEQEGYISRAQFASASNRCEDADRDMEQALKVGAKKDEVHNSYSRLIYQKFAFNPQPPYEPWTLDRALQEARQAYDINPLPAYKQQQAYVLFAKKQYAEAGMLFESIFDSPLRSPQLFYEAARCKQMQNDSIGYLALLDSAVALFSKPYLKEAAPFIITRAQARIEAGKNRDAVNDLNDYEQLMAAQVNDSFYYLRFQAEQGGRLYQQALNDITRAIQMNPQQEVYYAEKASLQVRVGQYDEAIQTAQECIRIEPQYSDGYLFLGLSQCLKGQKAEGVKNLQRAKELGDTQADALIEKYGK